MTNTIAALSKFPLNRYIRMILSTAAAKTFLTKLALATFTFSIMAVPLFANAKANKPTITKDKTLSRLASVQYLNTRSCFRDNVNVIISRLEEKKSGQPTSTTKKLEISVVRFNTCTQQNVINETVIVSDPSKFNIGGTQTARAEYKGKFPSGMPVEVHLKWTANGHSHTDEFNNQEQENGCQIAFTGSHTSSAPYTVTGSVVVNGENYIDGIAPVDSVIARDISRTKTTCPK